MPLLGEGPLELILNTLVLASLSVPFINKWDAVPRCRQAELPDSTEPEKHSQKLSIVVLVTIKNMEKANSMKGF